MMYFDFRALAMLGRNPRPPADSVMFPSRFCAEPNGECLPLRLFALWRGVHRECPGRFCRQMAPQLQVLRLVRRGTLYVPLRNPAVLYIIYTGDLNSNAFRILSVTVLNKFNKYRSLNIRGTISMLIF